MNLFFKRKLAIESDSKNDIHDFQFWREHIQETPIVHFPVNMFWEIFSSYGENKSPVQNLQNSNTGITDFDLVEKISTNCLLVQKEKFPLKLRFLAGPDSFR